MIDRRGSSGGCRRGAACFDDCRTALLHDGDEVTFEPSLVDEFRNGLAAGGRLEDVGVLGGRVVAPDRELLDVRRGYAGLCSQLGERTVVVETGQRREAFPRNVRGVAHGDQRIGVGRVAGDRDSDVVGRVVIECLALRGEDRAIGLEEVRAFHSLAARACANEKSQVGSVEDRSRVIPDFYTVEGGECAVVEFHHDAFKSLEGRGDFEQTQLHRSIGAEEGSARDAEKQAVADLAGGAGDDDLHRGNAHVITP